MTLQFLPYDLLLNIAQYLDLQDIHVLQLTCKSLHDFSTTRPVYRKFANALLRRCRALPLKGFQRLSDLTTEQLIDSVNKAARNERAWRVRAPRPITVSNPDDDSINESKKGRGITIDDRPRKWYKVVSAPPMEEVDWLSPITSSYTLCATKSGKVVCWDVMTDTCLAEWNPGERWELWKCRVEFEERTIFFTMAKVLSGSYDDDRVMEFVLMRLHFPEINSNAKFLESTEREALPTTPPPPVFSHVSEFKTTGVVMNVFLLDPPRRLLSAFVWVATTNTIGLYALLDWNKREYVFIDTGIECVLSSNWSCILYDSNVVIHSEESEAALQHFYPISLLQKYNTTLPSATAVPTIAARVTPPMTLSKKFIFLPRVPASGRASPEPASPDQDPDSGTPGLSLVYLSNTVVLLNGAEPSNAAAITSGDAHHNPTNIPATNNNAGTNANLNPFPFPPWYPESAHFVRQWWPTLPGLPRLSCTVVLLAAHDQVTHRTRFVLAQHYFQVPMSPSAYRHQRLWSESSSLEAFHRSEADNRIENRATAHRSGRDSEGDEQKHLHEPEEDLDDPLMKLWYVSDPFEVVCVLDGMVDDDDGTGGANERPRPLVAVDFGHAVWIEYVDSEEERAARPPGETEAKWLRFVTFPPVVTEDDADDDDDELGTYKNGKSRDWEESGVVRTLEIPDELDLDSVETINIDQSQGAVILSIKQGKIFILCYE